MLSAVSRNCIMHSPKSCWHMVIDKVELKKLNTGTDHQIAHLYDINTFQCYLSTNAPEIGVNGAINQVSPTYYIVLSGRIYCLQ